MGFAVILNPSRTFRPIGLRMRMKAKGRSHNKPNKLMGNPSW